jgi:general secretion pathway protein G
MSMVFQVKDPSQLDALQVGQKVRFQAVQDKKVEAPLDASGYPPNLEVLVEGVPDITQPDRRKIYFLRRLPRDPMNPDKELAPAQSWGLRSYESPADAPAPGEDVYDIYSTSDAVGLNGVPYREL